MTENYGPNGELVFRQTDIDQVALIVTAAVIALFAVVAVICAVAILRVSRDDRG